MGTLALISNMPALSPPAEAPKHCPICPRLVAMREESAAREPGWYNGAVPSFGDPKAELLIVGLAPGLKGANRTGRPFTGDGSGETLFEMLTRFGFTHGTFANEADDGLRLKNVMITNAVRCVPPQNKPVGAEINACRPFLTARIDALPRLKLVLALGKIAHESTLRALDLKLRDYPFSHASTFQIDRESRGLTLLSSYHCSRYNMNTRRLTVEMFEAIFAEARSRLSH
ncbi:MAG: uracil-DNA glycosylase [Pseudomonadota bacterium]